MDPTHPDPRPHRRPRRRLTAAAAVVLLALLAACGSSSKSADDTSATSTKQKGVTIKLLTHDSFAVSKGVLAAFTKETGITVKVVQGGDAGSVVNQAILTKGSPQGDVLFGVDNTLLTKALRHGIFEAHTPAAEAQVPADLQLDPTHHVAPVDYGDVCLNYDKAWFASHHVPVPTSLEDLVTPPYKGLLVVEDAATSSPGLAFLLATIDHFGPNGWQTWWTALRHNGVQVVDGWEQAYDGAFSGGGESKGTKPLVVSYASSPPAEVVYGGGKVKDSNVGVIQEGCYRQIEGAGVLTGTKHPKEAAAFVDFMESARFQADLPLQMFVYPVVPGVPLPEVFTRYAIRPTHVAALPPAEVDAHRDEWVSEWRDLVVN
jgi:thiamine transport system substrate-binding protein